MAISTISGPITTISKGKVEGYRFRIYLKDRDYFADGSGLVISRSDYYTPDENNEVSLEYPDTADLGFGQPYIWEDDDKKVEFTLDGDTTPSEIYGNYPDAPNVDGTTSLQERLNNKANKDLSNVTPQDILDRAGITITEEGIKADEADITAIKGDIREIKEDVTENATDIDNLETELTNAKADIARNASDIDDVEANVALNTTAIAGKEDAISSSNRIAAGNIANGTVSNAEFQTMSDINTNETIQSQLDKKQATIDSSNKLPASDVSGLATVATSGAYADLSGKPTIPSLPARTGAFSAADESKLDGIEANATADQTAAEIKTALETLTGTNRLDASAIKDLPQPGDGGLSTVQTDSTLTGSGTSGSPLSVANEFTDADESKLDGVETGATADQTATEIKDALETLTGTSRLDASAIQNIPSGGGGTTYDATNRLDADFIAGGEVSNANFDNLKGASYNLHDADHLGIFEDNRNGLDDILASIKLEERFDSSLVHEGDKWLLTGNHALQNKIVHLTDLDGIKNKSGNFANTEAEFLKYFNVLNTLPDEVGELAFKNAPTDLSTTEQEAVRNAIGAGTGSGGGSAIVGSETQSITGTNSGALTAGGTRQISVSAVGSGSYVSRNGIALDFASTGTYRLYGKINFTSSTSTIGRSGPSFRALVGTNVREIGFSNPYSREADTSFTVNRFVDFEVTDISRPVGLYVINRQVSASGGGVNQQTSTINVASVSDLRIIPIGGTKGEKGDKGDPGTGGGGGTTVDADNHIDAEFIADGSVSNTVFQYLSGATSNLQTQINAKEDAIGPSNRIAAGNIANGTISNTEVQTLNNINTSVTIQAQLDSKLDANPADVGDLAFSNPPMDLSDEEQALVRGAIGISGEDDNRLTIDDVHQIIYDAVYPEAETVTTWPDATADGAADQIRVAETIRSQHTVPAANSGHSTDQTLDMAHEPSLYKLTSPIETNKITGVTERFQAAAGNRTVNVYGTVTHPTYTDGYLGSNKWQGEWLYNPLGSPVLGIVGIETDGIGATWRLVIEESLYHAWVDTDTTAHFYARPTYTDKSGVKQTGPVIEFGPEPGDTPTDSGLRIHGGVTYRRMHHYSSIEFIETCYNNASGDTQADRDARAISWEFFAESGASTQLWYGGGNAGYTAEQNLSREIPVGIAVQDEGTDLPGRATTVNIVGPGINVSIVNGVATITAQYRPVQTVTQAEYDALTTKDSGTLYGISDA